MEKTDWGLEIRKVRDGFVLKDNEGNETVAKENKEDELSCAEDILNQVIDFFDLRGSRYDKERISVARVPGDKYEPPENE